MRREYELTPELLAWHEAGHVAAMEYVGEAWHSVHMDAESLSGRVETNPDKDHSRPVEPMPIRAEAIIGTSPELRKVSYRFAVRLYAGVAAERLFHGLPFNPSAFANQNFHDFKAARYMLGLTDSEWDWAYCALMACDIVERQRDRIEAVSKMLLAHGFVSFEDARVAQIETDATAAG
jgi:hypothetical protein